jgi:DNA-binding MarR family transcriptional regulator
MEAMSPIEEQIAPDATEAVQPAQESSMHVIRRLRRAFLSICRCGDVMFSPYRLTTEQYALIRAVQRHPGIRQADITDQIFAEPNTVTAMVTLLEKRGILRRKASPADGRVRLLYLTAHGQTVLQRLSSDWAPMRAVLRDCFSNEGGKQALDILDEVFRRMQREREILLQQSNPEFMLRPERETAPAEPEPKEAESAPPAKTPRAGRLAKPKTKPARKPKQRVENGTESGPS